MQISFFLNTMGIASMKWYEKNKIPYIEEWTTSERFPKIKYKKYLKSYCCGRIDASGHPDYPYNCEYSVAIMEAESWGLLGEWLSRLKLGYLPESVQDIYNMFESSTGHKIKWWEGCDEAI